MKGDFSRQTFDPRKHYTSVLMQQGRVQLDADWNEQEAIDEYRSRAEASDVIGACGAPEGAAGFAISIVGGQVRIGAGRFYAGGLLCENESSVAFTAQPDLPGVADPLAAIKKSGLGLVYLDVWERLATPLDDPRLREVALGGPDTAVRAKVVWQVKALPVKPKPAPNEQDLKALVEKARQLRLEIAKLTEAGAPPEEIQKLADAFEEIVQQILVIRAGAAAPDCGTDFSEWTKLQQPVTRTLNARAVQAPKTDDPCQVPPTAGYRRLENQLYRVEVHQPGGIGTATFKWSRDNGTVASSILGISGKEVTVSSIGPDDVLCFAPEQWVELSDDALELNGLPGQLAQVESVDRDANVVTLKSAPAPLDPASASGVDPARHPKLRRWDQGGGTAAASGVKTAGGWLLLDDGQGGNDSLEVQFAAPGGEAFATGDYWLIPARVATGELEWPPYQVPNASPLAQPPLGIRHHYCKLALVSFDAQTNAFSVQDCRPLFPPLTEAQKKHPAMRVTATNWINDDFATPELLKDLEFRITLDAVPDPRSVSADSVIATLEYFYLINNQPVPGILQPLILPGSVGLDPAEPRTIVWRWAAQSVNGLTRQVRALFGEAIPAQPAAPPPPPQRKGRRRGAEAAVAAEAASAIDLPALLLGPAMEALRAGGVETAAGDGMLVIAQPRAVLAVRLRFTVKGHLIWKLGEPADRPVYLDGRAFARPGVQADGKTTRHALVFPTGDQERASDFESWLWIGQAQPREPLQVKQARFLMVDAAGTEKPVENGTLAFPPAPDPQKPVVLSFKDGFHVVELTFNRPLAADGIAPNGDPQAISLDLMKADQVLGHMYSDLAPSGAGDVVRLVMRDPERPTERGEYRLLAAGDQVNDMPAVRAKDDGTRLDGDYSGAEGGPFVLRIILD